jgi:hypothetical protein
MLRRARSILAYQSAYDEGPGQWIFYRQERPAPLILPANEEFIFFYQIFLPMPKHLLRKAQGMAGPGDFSITAIITCLGLLMAMIPGSRASRRANVRPMGEPVGPWWPEQSPMLTDRFEGGSHG